jgi:hypothetical protein
MRIGQRTIVEIEFFEIDDGIKELHDLKKRKPLVQFFFSVPVG